MLCTDALKLASSLKAKVVEAYPEPGSQRDQEYKTWNTFNGFESHFSKLGFKKIPKDFGDHEKFYRPMQTTVEEGY